MSYTLVMHDKLKPYYRLILELFVFYSLLDNIKKFTELNLFWIFLVVFLVWGVGAIFFHRDD